MGPVASLSEMTARFVDSHVACATTSALGTSYLFGVHATRARQRRRATTI